MYSEIVNNLKESSNAEKMVKKYINVDYEDLEADDISDWDAYNWLVDLSKKYPAKAKEAKEFISDVEKTLKEEPDENPFEILDYGTFDILELANNIITEEHSEVKTDNDKNIWKVAWETENSDIEREFTNEAEARAFFKKKAKQSSVWYIYLYKNDELVEEHEN